MIDALLIAAAIETAQPKLSVESRTIFAADIAASVDSLEDGIGLVATIDGESKFDERIGRCECKAFECDGKDPKTGQPVALGLPQLHRHWLAGHPVAEVCASNALAIGLAARALVTLKKRTGTIRRALVAYIGCKKTDSRATRRLAVYERLIANARKAAAS